jgi:hypothetical protein
MNLIIPIDQDLALKITDEPENQPGFPTARLQKGLVLLDKGQELAEEGVGFGVPVAMRGLETIFPGNVQLSASETGSLRVVQAMYALNLVEKIGPPGQSGIESRLLYALKNNLAALIRRLPFLRGLLTGLSNLVRKVFGWQTLYERAEDSLEVHMTYTIDPQSGCLEVELETQALSAAGVTELIVMNEQGARSFDTYIDSSGCVLHGKEIGCWDETTAGEASFASPARSIAFSLRRVDGARLFRGRELIGSRLAWSGFGYCFPPTIECFRYQVKIRRIP